VTLSPCPSCRAPLEPGLPVCVGCGRLFPEEDELTRALVIRRAPEEREARRELARLLAAASGRNEEAVIRYLEGGRALFRLSASDLVTERLHEALADAGAELEPDASITDEREWVSWLRSLWRERPHAALLTIGAGLAIGLVRPGLSWLWLGWVLALGAADLLAFRRRITLTPALLARRLGMTSGGLARPASALLRRARSAALREALGAVLVEHARLLGMVTRVLVGHPALQAPFRATLEEVGQRALGIVENAVAIEEAGDPESEDVLARLTDLRALGNAEVDRQLRELLTSRDQRQARSEWLARTHALLLLRLEAIAERLRGLRQDAAQRLVALHGPTGPAADHALGSLGRELELAAAAVSEVEQGLPQPLPEVIAEVVGDRRD
jgi:Flp pilus assembly pilin Flp